MVAIINISWDVNVAKAGEAPIGGTDTHKPRPLRGSSKGFTLIEVVLVLAIGGLIFLLAFLAFSQVSQNRRDNQRRLDVRRLLGLIEESRSDSDGRYPCSAMQEAMPASYGDRLNTVTSLSVCDTTIKGLLLGDDAFNYVGSGARLGYVDPSAGGVDYTSVRTRNQLEGFGRITITVGSQCGASGGLEARDQGRWIALRIRLESGGIFCIDNS